MSACITPLAPVVPGPDGADPRAAAAHIEALFREHYAALVRFAAHYTLAADAVSVEVTPSYLYSAVRYRALPLLRRERVARRWSEREAVVLRLDRGVGTCANDAEVALETDDLARAAWRAVAGLSDKTRAVFLLSRARRLTYAEIAAVLGISVKTVELHMTRALKALRAGLRAAALAAVVMAATTPAGVVEYLAGLGGAR